MRVLLAEGAGPLASLVRDQQDLLSRRQGELRCLDVAAGRADAEAAEDVRAALAAVDKKLDAVDAKLAAEFKDYAELVNPKPLTIGAVQALLMPDEALVVFLDVTKLNSLPEESAAWVVTKGTALWLSIPLGTHGLAERVAALRCGLDRAAWEGEWALPCANLLGLDVTPKETEPLPFAWAIEAQSQRQKSSAPGLAEGSLATVISAAFFGADSSVRGGITDTAAGPRSIGPAELATGGRPSR